MAVRSKLCPDWSRDDVKWYMLSNAEAVGRIGLKKNAPPGRIFEIAYEGDERNDNDSGITLKSCCDDKIKVKWRSGVFYGLDDDEKEILLAEQDFKERLKLFEELPQHLAFAKKLKLDDSVTVRLKYKRRILHVDGTIRYIGKDVKTPGRFFGVQLDCPLDPSVDDKFDWCKNGRGVLVSVSSLGPPPSKQGAKRNAKSKRGGQDTPKDSHTDDDPLGLNAPLPSYVGHKDAVLVRTRMVKDTGKDVWARGIVVFIKENKVAVEVDVSEGHVCTPWKGYIHGNKVFHNYSSHTVLVDREDVSPIGSTPVDLIQPATEKYSPGVGSNSLHQNQSSQKGKEGFGTGMKNTPGSAVRTNPLAGRNQSKKKEGTESKRKADVKSPNGDGLKQFGSFPVNPNYPQSHERVSSTPGLTSSMKNLKEDNCSADVDEDGERFSSCQSALSMSGDGEKSLVIEETKKSLPSKIVSLLMRPDPPPYPFSDYEVFAIAHDGVLCKNLVADLMLERKWKQIVEKEKEKYFRMERLLQHWWKEINEGHKEQLCNFKTILSKSGGDDIRDHIDKAPDRGTFHETVLNTLLVSASKCWRNFVSELGLEQRDLNPNIKRGMSDSDCLEIAIRIWYRKEEGCSKLSKLVRACHHIEQYTVADEIEQGFSDLELKKIARLIEAKSLVSLGNQLQVSPVRQHAFKEKFPSLQDRVYNMLCYWSMIQPYDTDKEEKLASALRRINLGHVADTVLYKGLQQHELETIAAYLGDSWQKLAAICLNAQDIDYIMSTHGDSTQRAFKCLKLWKRRLSSDTEDAKESLYIMLIQQELNREARQLYNGLDPYTLMELSKKLIFDWPLLANYFQYKKVEIADRLREKDQIAECLKVLQEWLHANRHGDQTEIKAKLLEGFVIIGREDIVDWLQNRENGEPEVASKSQMMQRASTSQTKKLDRLNLGKIASKLHRDHHGLMDMLSLNQEDLQGLADIIKQSPMLSPLVAWKKKQKREYFGEAEMYDQLMELLKLYDEQEALSVLSDGSSVDPPSYGNAPRGAVGGSPVHEEPAYPDVNVDSMVEVTYGAQTLTGVIRWIGDIKGIDGHGKLAGVELDDFLDIGGIDGSFNGRSFFHCQYGRGLFLPLTRCKPDSRFLTETETFTKKDKLTKEDFGGMDCDPIEGYVVPPNIVHRSHVGLFKGIQGDHNSCYMDVTLFSMFAYNSVFDAILSYDDSTKEDIRLIKDALRKTIVNPLRSIGYVRADYVLAFRDLLSGLSSMQGLRTEEKDPEEFIHALLQELLSTKPFLNISQGKNATMESYVYQIFLDKTDNADTSTVSDLLHMSFRQSDLKLSEVPECLIIQLPRYGKKYKLYDWIIPSLEMDISLLIHENPRQCVVCGKLALTECKDCEPQTGDDSIIQSFCTHCFNEIHSSKPHHSVPLTVSQKVMQEFQKLSKEVHEDDLAYETQHLYPEHRMELFSVVCIETSHYVAFVKTGSGREEEWIFFDSMADRKGDQHGYNIPEVTHLKDFRKKMESESLRADVKIPSFSKYLKRLLSDAYICFYRPVKKDNEHNLGSKGDQFIRSVSHQPSFRQEEHEDQSQPSRSNRDQGIVQSRYGENHQGKSRHQTRGLDQYHATGGKQDYGSCYHGMQLNSPGKVSGRQTHQYNNKMDQPGTVQTGTSERFCQRNNQQGYASQQYDNNLYHGGSFQEKSYYKGSFTNTWQPETESEGKMDWQVTDSRGNNISEQFDVNCQKEKFGQQMPTEITSNSKTRPREESIASNQYHQFISKERLPDMTCRSDYEGNSTYDEQHSYPGSSFEFVNIPYGSPGMPKGEEYEGQSGHKTAHDNNQESLILKPEENGFTNVIRQRPNNEARERRRHHQHPSLYDKPADPLIQQSRIEDSQPQKNKKKFPLSSESEATSSASKRRMKIPGDFTSSTPEAPRRVSDELSSMDSSRIISSQNQDGSYNSIASNDGGCKLYRRPADTSMTFSEDTG